MMTLGPALEKVETIGEFRNTLEQAAEEGRAGGNASAAREETSVRLESRLNDCSTRKEVS
jgi:hypothetical protein